MSDVTLTQPDLATPRLRLRPLRRSDAAVIALYCASAELARMTTSIPHPYPPGLAESFIARVSSEGSDESVWALDTGDDGGNGLIGLIALRPRRGGVAEIGYWVAPAFQGAGYASEALDALIGHAQTRGFRALVAEAFQENLAAVKVLTRAGFAFEGEGERYALARSQMVPTFRYRSTLGAAA